MSDPLLDALRDFYGYDSFRPQQRETIEHVRDGGDALVLMPTGGGKSLCYQLPAILSDGLTVVVSPLIALMHDQVQALRRAGANAQYLNSTLSLMESAQVERLVASGDVRLLYVAPERVNTDRFRALLERRPPSLIAIDEAHCISEWGHEFRPDYRLLRRLTEHYVDVPTVACTATATPQVQRDIVEQLDRPRMQTFITSFLRDNLTLRIVPKRKALDRLVARLQQTPGEAAIVYSTSRNSTEENAARLRQHGINAEHYHGAMTGEARRQVQDRFLSGRTPVICATIAFGMGIDKPDIRLVAHLDMPSSIESYYQETGRAGRDGAPSECLLFYTKGVWHQQMFFINQLTDDAERQQRINRLRTMMNFCEQSQCRWARILQYFGEQPASEQCGHCDNCLGDAGDLPLAESSRAVAPDDPPSPPGRNEPRPLSQEEDRLYEALRQRRSQLARDEAVSAFIVASNRDLAALAQARPATLSELRGVKGFGAKKVERYGEALLQVIAEFSSEQPATQPDEMLTLAMQAPDSVEATPEEQPLEPPTPQPTNQSDAVPSWQTTLDLYQAGHTILAIAERRMLSPGTVSSHLITALRNGHDVDLRPALPPTEVIQAVRRLLAADPDASVATLQERFDYRLSRAEMSLVVAHLRPPEIVGD